jgi:3-phenylpropionate/trans-cinnamate dioxygenase ferredoxin subunit
MSSWVQVSTLAEVPEGQVTTVTMPGKITIALFNVDGTVYAVDDFCPHMGAPLSKGCVEGTTVICPWHDAKFSLISGSVLNDSPAYGSVKTYKVRVEGEEIQLEWPPDGGKLFIR